MKESIKGLSLLLLCGVIGTPINQVCHPLAMALVIIGGIIGMNFILNDEF